MTDTEDETKVDTHIRPREPIAALPSAHAPMIPFDEASFFGAIGPGIGEIALTVNRYADARGTEVLTERVRVAHLRANLPALLTLKYAVDLTIDMLEAACNREVAGERAMAILRNADEPEFRN